MTIEPKQLNNWYTEYKEKKLERDIKRCNAFSIVSGSVATLSSLIIAGNIIIGNGLEVMQLGGSTIAMFAYTLCYSRMSSLYKMEQEKLKDRQTNPKTIIKTRLEELRHELELNETSLNMDYIVTTGFYASSLGHVLELINVQDAPQIITSITGAALSALVATLYLGLIKMHKKRVKRNKLELEGLEQVEELENKSTQQTPEIIEQKDVLELTVPQEEPDKPKILQLEEITKKK